ncbi:MAG: DUF116 domain-containing protein [Candidatus Latescibacteria bacterium]|nr:DUF116 domain-containing protein [Candidatus Latescibacterota bacterium]NIM21379.1 DUF116 domain-containing protein [Candidatus Latescibacterota bacterium]NIM65560.1 DUF116 domain-containing protein [Candidatus Latescibacterota bacterium]NIO01940.1 DUF116 domain-containing protein [Candidatus Latescibacterota bacterium]NIO28753.1 DUF116 domain-containing protein [Candidatus Latescibacterota bacterium]
MTRKLGDEWASWDGELISPEEVRAGRRLFLALLLASLTLSIAFAYFFLFLISPRLAQLSERLPLFLAVVLGVLAALCALWFISVILNVKSPGSLFHLPVANRIFYEFSTLAERLGRKLGISRDRLGHSFIRVSNALTIGRLKLKPNLRILILLPRCLTKEARERIMETCSRYKVVIKFAGGGEVARKYIQQLSPDAIIGVACERDLVSGIQDVAQKIPVIGIPNIRPDGPCKETHIEYSDLEETLTLIYGG